MRTMKIFEPAMCCPTGLCGVSIDPELLRVSTALNTLKQSGIKVQRYNLSSAPQEFVKSEAVSEYLRKFGPDKLPAVVVDDMIVIAGRYPTNEEFTKWLDLSPDVLGVSCCGGDTSCCCGDSGADEICCCGDAPADESCCYGDGGTDESCCCGDAPADESCCAGDAPAGDCCCGGRCG